MIDWDNWNLSIETGVQFVYIDSGVEVELEGEEGEIFAGGLADSVLQALGGKDNIVSVDSCITRLRVEVVNVEKVDDNVLKRLGAAGVLKVGKNGVQAVFGSKAQFICNDINQLI